MLVLRLTVIFQSIRWAEVFVYMFVVCSKGEIIQMETELIQSLEREKVVLN